MDNNLTPEEAKFCAYAVRNGMNPAGTIYIPLGWNVILRKLDDIALSSPEENNQDAWLIFYEDADIRPEVFMGEGAEEAAKHRFKEALTNWNCHLFKRVAQKGTNDL